MSLFNYFHQKFSKLKSIVVEHCFYILTFFTGFVLCLFFVGVSIVMLQKTSTNEFCGLCHEMQSAYLSWQDSSHFNNKQGVVADCVDCHAPADLPGYIYVKTKTGIKDVIVHNFGEPQKIDWLERRKNKNNFVYESGCLSCHKNLTESKISKVGLMAHKSYFNGETDQSCVDCHSDLAHPNRKSYENQEYKNLKKDYK